MIKARQLPLIRFTRKAWRPPAKTSSWRSRPVMAVGADCRQEAFRFPTGHPSISYQLQPRQPKDQS
jgi:hypothetical protein